MGLNLPIYIYIFIEFRSGVEVPYLNNKYAVAKWDA